MATPAVSGRDDPPASFGLGISISPGWTPEDSFEQLLEVAQIASRRRASVFLMGDRSGSGPDVRSNAVLLAWVLPELAGVARIGSLFLVRRTPVDRLLPTVRTLGGLIRHAGSIPAIGVMQGRAPTDASLPGPDVEEAAQVFRDDSTVGDMELWVGAERGAALDRAAAIGDVWLANAYYDDEALLSQMGRLLEAARRPVRRAARRDFVCDPDSDKAHATARRLLADGYRGGKFGEAVLVAGTPAECLERIAGVAALGFDDILVRPAVDGPAAVEQIHLLFEEWDRR